MLKKSGCAVFFAVAAGAMVFWGCKKNANPVVARAGSIRITAEDLTKELVNSPPAYQNYLSTLEGKKQFLDILLREKILLNAAQRSGIEKRKEVQKNIEEYRQRAKDQESEFRKGLVLREYLRELKDKELKVSEPEIKQYYDQNKADFQSPVKVTASHILCTAQSEAEAALRRVRSGEDFSRVAREVSSDPSASRGGLIGEISKGDLADLPEFESALFSLKSGQVSDVVRTKIGFHIIKKNGEIRLRGQTYDQSAAQIHRVLEKKKFDEWVDKAKKEQKVWVDDKTLASIPVGRPERPAQGAQKPTQLQAETQ